MISIEKIMLFYQKILKLNKIKNTINSNAVEFIVFV